MQGLGDFRDGGSEREQNRSRENLPWTSRGVIIGYLANLSGVPRGYWLNVPGARTLMPVNVP